VNERRAQKKAGNFSKKKKDMMDALLEVEDEEGNKLTDEDIIDILIMYLNAGHESSGHTIMWATTFLQQHPEYFQKAKVLEITFFEYSFLIKSFSCACFVLLFSFFS
jgi:ent-kaurenoic acid hydroxylase